MNLLIRADASVAIGTGHVMRCLALAWQVAGGNAVFATAQSTRGLQDRARMITESWCRLLLRGDIQILTSPRCGGDRTE